MTVPIGPEVPYQKKSLKALLQAKNEYLAFLDKIRRGVHPSVAAASVGVVPTLFRKWLAKGRDSTSGIYRKLADDVTLAIADVTASVSEEIRLKKPEEWLGVSAAREVFDTNELPILERGRNPLPSTNQTFISVNQPPPTVSKDYVVDAMVELKRLGVSFEDEAIEGSVEVEE